jgi:hypothetical protein
MPKFFVKRTFEIPAREIFVLAGEIVEGEVAQGMFVNVPFNSELKTRHQINCIEYVRSEKTEDVCLCLRTEKGEAEILRALNLADETLEVG